MATNVNQGSLQVTFTGDQPFNVNQASLQAPGQSSAPINVQQAAITIVVRFFEIRVRVPVPPPVILPLICSCNPVPCFNDGC